jgi:hypothetical protein
MNFDHLQLNCLKFFESEEPLFYESPQFRKVLPKIFRSSVERKIATVLWIPSGQRFENAEIDDIRDETFAQCQWQLDGYQIVNGDNKVNGNDTGKRDNTPMFRYQNGRRFVLRIATNAAVRARRRKGRLYYVPLQVDLVTDGPPCGRLSDTAVGSGPQGNRTYFEKLRGALGSKVKDLDFELFRLRCEEGMQPREINQMYSELTLNLIRVKIWRVKKAVRILLTDPNAVRRLRGEKDDE